MLLQDNFVHTDLHAGNIMVRIHPGQHPGQPERVQLVLLDFGLAEELTPEVGVLCCVVNSLFTPPPYTPPYTLHTLLHTPPTTYPPHLPHLPPHQVRFRFISFLSMLAKGDADAATHHLLRWSSTQTCTDPEALVQDMKVLFAEQCDVQTPGGVDLDAVLKGILRLARRHTVAIDSNYAALVIGVCVLVGFATSLDPKVNLMDAAAPCLFAYNLTGRVLGRLYG